MVPLEAAARAFRAGCAWPRARHLVVTATKIERLQDISEEDARAEGIVSFASGTTQMYGVRCEGSYEDYGLTARESFMNLWCLLHGPDAWVDNPDIVALSFSVHRCNIDAMAKVTDDSRIKLMADG